ncbi:MAG: glucokinase, partial [Pseudomonadota bacterium]
MMAEAVLVGDIGGTNVRLAEAVRRPGGHLEISDIEILRGDDFADFDGALDCFIQKQNGQQFDSALFAFAGPVRANAIEMTNRDWVIDGAALAHRFGLKSVHLVNDYAAMARAIPELAANMFQPLHAGKPPQSRAP